MSDGQNTGRTTLTGNDLIDAAETVGASLARVGVAMVGWPFYVLPPQARNDALDATTGLFNAVGELHLSLVKAVIRGLDAATHELNQTTAVPTQSSARTPTKVPIETTPPTAR